MRENKEIVIKTIKKFLLVLSAGGWKVVILTCFYMFTISGIGLIFFLDLNTNPIIDEIVLIWYSLVVISAIIMFLSIIIGIIKIIQFKRTKKVGRGSLDYMEQYYLITYHLQGNCLGGQYLPVTQLKHVKYLADIYLKSYQEINVRAESVCGEDT